MLKAARGKDQVTCISTPIRVIPDFLIETLKGLDRCSTDSKRLQIPALTTIDRENNKSP